MNGRFEKINEGHGAYFNTPEGNREALNSYANFSRKQFPRSYPHETFLN